MIGASSPKVLVPLALLAVGVALLVFLVATRPKPEKRAPPERVIPVDVVVAQRENVRALVEARGQVQAAQLVDLETEVAGRVVWASADLVPGGRLKKGQRLLRIEQADYELAVRAQRGEVSQAEVQLRQERNRQEVSRRTWDRYRARNGAEGEADPALVLNEPQIVAAERALEAARSRLEQAELDLRRTVLNAPFNASVVRGQVDVGRRVASGQVLATLAGTDHYWVNASVDVDDLHLLQVPEERGATQGSIARIDYVSRSGRTRRVGRVLKLVKELEAEGSMARILVQVEDPLGLNRDRSTANGRGPPLLIGAFVDVQIEGDLLEKVFVLPEEVLYEGNNVWIVDDEERLQRRRVDVLRQQQGNAIVVDGLKPGERVVRSHLPLAIVGTRVRPEQVHAEAP